MEPSAFKLDIPIFTLSRWLLSTGLLLGLWWWLGPQAIWTSLQGLELHWVILALAVGTFQVLASAWRWRFTARCLGLPLSFRQAVSEYYLASFINQVLPGGVVGDLYRAKRHSQASARRGPAWQAVILERLSGQLVLVVLTLFLFFTLPTWQTFASGAKEWLGSSVTAITILMVTAIVILIGALPWLRLRFRLSRPTTPPHWASAALMALGQGLKTAYWPASRLGIQLLGSTVIVGSYVLVFVLATASLKLAVSPWVVVALAPPLLLAMVVPVTVSGWGLREWVAAAAWGSIGLDPAQGVAVSVVYGLLIFLTALPGVVMWRTQELANSINSSSPH